MKEKIILVGWILVFLALIPTVVTAFQKVFLGEYGNPGKNFSGSALMPVYPIIVLIVFSAILIIGLSKLIIFLNKRMKR